MPDTPMTPEARKLYLDVLLDEDLMSLREQFSRTVAEQLGTVAAWLGIDSFLGGGDVIHPAAPPKELDPDRHAAFRGVSTVVEMAAELAAGGVAMLESSKRYAAAALIRQLIECEYLLRAFVEEIGNAATWYRATPSEIRSAFQPKTMRSLGGFSDREYWTHCDQGGHPSPSGRHLLRFGLHAPSEGDRAITASTWGDLAQHLGRVWRAVCELLSSHHARFVRVRASQIAAVDEIGTRWTKADPFSRSVNFSWLNEMASIELTADDPRT